MGRPVTVDPSEMQKFLSGAGKRVILCTYQFSSQIVAAQKQWAPAFDLVISDEARHCAGRVDSAFATVLHPDSLKETRRLFMTTTPRDMSGSMKDTAKQADIQITSMDNESVFGPEFHALKFGEAIKEGYLCDYQMVVMGVTDREVKQLAENRVLVQLLGTTSETNAQSLAAILGTLKAIQKYDIRRVIYCASASAKV